MAKHWSAKLSELLFERPTASAMAHEKYQIHNAWLALKRYQADIEQGFALQIAQAIETEVGSSSGCSTRRFQVSTVGTTSSLLSIHYPLSLPKLFFHELMRLRKQALSAPP